MGQARQRGTFEERKAQAIEAGRTPEARRKAKQERETLIRKLTQELIGKLLTGRL